MSKTVRLTATLLALAFAMPLLAACNTTEGAGKDISAAGKAISTTADKAKP